jgi:hypothetical protein
MPCNSQHRRPDCRSRDRETTRGRWCLGQLECGDPGAYGGFEGAIGGEWQTQEICLLVAMAAVISGAAGCEADRGRRRPRP